MSLPVEPDFAIIKKGDGGGTEVFAILCGQQDIQINGVANLSDRFVRDCAQPNVAPIRKTKLTGKQYDVTASGLIDKAQLVILHAALGKVNNYKIELYTDDGTTGGLLYGTYSGAFRLASVNVNLQREGDALVEITLPNHGDVTLTTV